MSEISFITPKTNWIKTDRFNINDYNRIKNNLNYLGIIGNDLFSAFSLNDMGADKTEYIKYWKPSEFNLFEENLDIIVRNFPKYDAGVRKTFFENAPFIDYKELNRIESAILYFYKISSTHKATLPRLAVRIGNMRGVKV